MIEKRPTAFKSASDSQKIAKEIALSTLSSDCEGCAGSRGDPFGPRRPPYPCSAGGTICGNAGLYPWCPIIIEGEEK